MNGHKATVAIIAGAVVAVAAIVSASVELALGDLAPETYLTIVTASIAVGAGVSGAGWQRRHRH